jgi:uncharacterized DUF497 family protein
MTPEKATFELRALIVEGVRISWEIPHAEQRAIERDVPKFEAERIIRTGVVVRTEPDPSGPIRWRIAGTDSDGRPVDVVVKAVRGALRVITVIRTDLK